MALCKDMQLVFDKEKGKKVCKYASRLNKTKAVCLLPYKLTFLCHYSEKFEGFFTEDAEVVSLEMLDKKI